MVRITIVEDIAAGKNIARTILSTSRQSITYWEKKSKTYYKIDLENHT
jgi:hypothetical protein